MNSTWMHPVAPSESPLTRIRLRGVSMGSDSRESKPNQRVFGAAKGDPEADSALHHAEFSDHVRNHPNYHQPEPHGASE